MSRIGDATTRARILRAAEELLAASGEAGAPAVSVPLEEIAAHAEVAPSVLRREFASAEAVLAEIVESWLVRCAALFADPSEYPDPADEPDALLDFSFERELRLYDFLWETRSTLALVRRCQDRYAERVIAFRSEMMRRHREWLELWQDEGLLRCEIDTELAASLMSGAHEELTLRMLRCPVRPPIETWLEFAQATFLRAYGTPELVHALDRRTRRSPTDIRQVRSDSWPPRAQPSSRIA